MWIHSTGTQYQKVILYSKMVLNVGFKDFWYIKSESKIYIKCVLFLSCIYNRSTVLDNKAGYNEQ